MRPLDGIRVLDFSTLLPGPMATLFLAEAGAEVIKIERPGSGDDMRGYAPNWGDDSVNFAMLNRGKKSIAVDLKDASQRARLQPLLVSADILVEQFRPGVMERLGLGYQALSRLNTGMIYCSITGYGQTGPRRDVAGHDLNYIGDAGLLALSHGPRDAPVVPPALIADIAGGTYPALLNILLALRMRDRSGRGTHLDIAMSEGVMPFMYWALGAGQAGAPWPGNGNGLVTGGTARYRLYATSDGRFVAAAPIEQKFWEAFAAAIGLAPELVRDDVDPQASIAGVARIIARETSRHWRPILAKADCCATIMSTAEEAMSDPHFAARGVFAARVVNSRGQSIAALPVPIAPAFRAPADQPIASPALGADTKDVLG